MQLHQLKPTYKKKRRKLVGRGGKHGTYSGRGQKGQKARAGSHTRAGFAGGQTPFFRRLPKQRGATKKIKLPKAKKLRRYSIKPAIVNLQDLERYFKNNEIVSPQTLLKKDLIVKIKGRLPAVKILGDGKLTKKLSFYDCLFSKSAAKALKIDKKF